MGQTTENFAKKCEPWKARVVTAQRPQPGPGEIDQVAALLVPLMGAVAQSNGAPLWRADEALLAISGNTPSLSCSLSHWLSRAFLLIPLGNHTLRFALLGAVAAGCVGVLTLKLSHELLQRQGGYSRLDRFLALGAAVSVGLGLPVLSEATVVGGAVPGAALGLLCLLLLLRHSAPVSRVTALGRGLALGALLVESPACGAGLLVVNLVLWPEVEAQRRGHLDRARELRTRLALCWGTAVSFGGVLWVASALSQPVLLDTTLWADRSPTSSPWPLFGATSWLESVGFLWSLAALVGAAFGLRERRPVVALLLFVTLDVLLPGRAAIGWNAAPTADAARMSLHLAALGVVTSLGALGMRTLAESAYALRLFAARPLATMVGALALAGCLAGAEDAVRTLSHTNRTGTQAFTDEALAPLPHGALVLTRSDAWSHRLRAAQSQGQRPDVLVVPLTQLVKAGTVRRWLAAEPKLELLLRDLSVSETPSEHALAHLIDARPVFLEPNPDWDRRLLEHVLPSVPLSEFSPYALGRSDRIARLERDFQQVDARIREGASSAVVTDPVSLALYEQSLVGLVALFDKIHDGGTKRSLLSLLKKDQTPAAATPTELAPVARRPDW